ncbi:MAG: hypothetical protein R2831_12890 [Chitinophagaceae bacterium]
MYKTLITLVFMLFCFQMQAQIDAQSITKELNFCIQQFSTDNKALLNISNKSGTIEQAVHDKTLRYPVSEVHDITVEKSKLGYTVTCTCLEKFNCFTLLNKDMSSSSFSTYAYSFDNLESANTFAKGLYALAKNFNEDFEPIVSYAKNEEGNEVFLVKKENQNQETKPLPKQEKNFLAIETGETESNERPQHKSQRSKAEREEEEDNDIQEESTPRPTRTKKEKETENEMVDDRNSNEDAMSDDIACKRIMSLAEAGKSQFKSIEGKETNAEKKINESTLKLKGARKNYLSMNKGKRIFIAEYKLIKDYELALEACDALQGEIEECLGSEWEFEDRSNNDEYLNLDYTARDVEYSHATISAYPKFHIMLLHDGKNYVVFLRVQ